MGSESIAHEAEGLRGMRVRGIIIVLVKPNQLIKNIEAGQL